MVSNNNYVIVFVDSDIDPVDVTPDPVQEQNVQQFYDAVPTLRYAL